MGKLCTRLPSRTEPSSYSNHVYLSLDQLTNCYFHSNVIHTLQINRQRRISQRRPPSGVPPSKATSSRITPRVSSLHPTGWCRLIPLAMCSAAVSAGSTISVVWESRWGRRGRDLSIIMNVRPPNCAEIHRSHRPTSALVLAAKTNPPGYATTTSRSSITPCLARKCFAKHSVPIMIKALLTDRRPAAISRFPASNCNHHVKSSSYKIVFINLFLFN
jgi:hypothetical protein